MKKLKMHRPSFSDDGFEGLTFEKIKTGKRQPGFPGSRLNAMAFRKDETGFKCAACKNWVSSAREDCGVNHRNHCPYCLVSRHVDLHKAGDRLSACRSRMVPIGLTFKKTLKRYAKEGQGELMIIHRCAGCGKININRIAADDNPEALYALAKACLELPGDLLVSLSALGILALDANGFDAAYAQIYGLQPIRVELTVKTSVEIAE